MATATTPTRPTASRSAAPSSSRSSRSHNRATSRGNIPSSPLARMVDDADIQIDPALLSQDGGELQDDLDAEGEVDDGVGYYMPPQDYYYPPPPADAYVPSPLETAPPLLPDLPRASSSSQLVVPPNGFNYGSAPASVASPLSTTSNGTVVVKRKRGRPRKDGSTTPRVNGTVPKVAKTPRQQTPRQQTPRQQTPRHQTPRHPQPRATNGSGSAMMSAAQLQPHVTPVQRVANGTATHPITPETVCSLCGGTEVRNRDGHREKMVSCVRCGRSGHPTCLGITNPDVVKKMRNYEWCCIECKPCEVCRDKGEDHKLLFCDGCDRGWHSYCLNPPLSAPPKGMWYCPMCTGHHKPTTKASSSKLAAATPSLPSSRKGKGRAVEDLDTPKISARERKKALAAATPHSDPFPDLILPKLKIRTSAQKDRDKDRAGDKDKEKKDRRRSRVPSPPSPIPLPDPPTPTGIVVRLRVPSASRKDVQIEEEEEPVPYGGILEGEDADTTRTKIVQADKDIFNKALKVSEARLGGPPPPLWDPQAMAASPVPPSRPSTPGPSKATPRPVPTKATPSATPGNMTPLTPSMSRSLRDRVLLQQTVSLSGIPGAPSTPSVESPSSGRPEKINKIRFGIYDIDTWYTAPYPEEYAQVPDGRLWLCEFCLKYMKSGFVAGRHRMKCKSRHPPGDEIYRDGAISVFEVDGRKNKIYCQNLCLLAKMFLDHKTLYYDVEPFLFYVMTEVDEMGARFVGYFSKEKRTPENNVSCIMTLPVRQRKGWGQLLIDFSYLLSKKEGRVGSPERPLSGLGALSYKSYWRLTVFKYLSTVEGRVTIEDISAATSMTPEDIFTTLEETRMITVLEPAVPFTPISRPKPRRGRPPKNPRPLPVQSVEDDLDEGKEPKIKLPERYEITPDMKVVEEVLRRHNAKGYLTLKPERLKYTPFLVTRDPVALPAHAAAFTGDRANGHVGRSRAAASETPSSGNKEVISTPVDPELTPITPAPKDKITAGEDQATLDLVAALSASPVRSLRRRSMPSSERPPKRRRSESATTPLPSSRRRSTHDIETPTRGSRKAPRSHPHPTSRSSSKRVFLDPDEEEWGDEDAEGEDDDEYVEDDDE